MIILINILLWAILFTYIFKVAMQFIWCFPVWRRQQINVNISMKFELQRERCFINKLVVLSKTSFQKCIQSINNNTHSNVNHIIWVNVQYMITECVTLYISTLPREYSTKSRSKSPGIAVPCPREPPLTISDTFKRQSVFK